MNHPASVHIPPRVFRDWGQLTFAAQGVMSVETGEQAWIVPPHRALWVPPGVEHEIRMRGPVQVRTLFFARRFAERRTASHIAPINVSPLLRELILHITARGSLRRDVNEERRLAEVALDQLELSDDTPLQLPMPRDPRARYAAAILLTPRPDRSLAVVARESGASTRTLERLFRRETAMSFGKWRGRATALCALPLLARGLSTADVAYELGYSGASAFAVAFKRELGTSPREYVA